MKILYILKQDPDETLTEFIKIHSNSNEVRVIDIRESRNYADTLELIENCDKVISC